MSSYRVVLVLFVALFATACGPGKPAADSAAAKTAKSEPNPVGRCAVDARDGAPYGKITSVSVEPTSNERMYRIENKSATWNKKAGNVKVVDCK